MDEVLNIQGLTKSYGKSRGVIDLNLTVERGEVFGYLGPNGAGKTTTIRVLLNFIRPTHGQVTIFGMNIRQKSRQVRKNIGYLPGEVRLYEKLTGAEFLQYVGHLRNGVNWQYVEELAERLQCNLSRRIRSLSHGNKKKLGLIQAFMHKPELIILDEPTAGLDPLMQQEFYRLIDESKASGCTVLLSSHNMPEVERVCDRVGLIREGRLITVENVDALKTRALRQIEIYFAASVPRESFSGIPGVRNVILENNVLRCTVTGTLDTLIKAIAQYEVVNLISHEPNLEEIFLSYYSGGENHAV